MKDYNVQLNNGFKMPHVMMGTTGFSDYKNMSDAINSALLAGCRGFDTSMFYRTGNKETEYCLGRILNDYFEKQTSIKREDVFITTKITIPQLVRGEIVKNVHESLRRLRTGYIDCLLIHWPFPEYYIQAYKVMENLYEQGLVKSIGVSNCQVRHLRTLLEAGIRHVPMVHQCEVHPLNTASNIRSFCEDQSIAIQSYSPLAKMLEPLKESRLLKDLADKYQKTLAQVVLRWHVQLGLVPIFRTENYARVQSNLDILDFEIFEDDINKITSLNQDYKICVESSRCPGY